jgi:hypothetical protein
MTIYVAITTAEPGHPICQAASEADQLASTVRAMLVGAPVPDYLADLDRLQTAVLNGVSTANGGDLHDLQCRLDVWVKTYDHPVAASTVHLKADPSA